jgi:hypothetical protein
MTIAAHVFAGHVEPAPHNPVFAFYPVFWEEFRRGARKYFCGGSGKGQSGADKSRVLVKGQNPNERPQNTSPTTQDGLETMTATEACAKCGYTDESNAREWFRRLREGEQLGLARRLGYTKIAA